MNIKQVENKITEHLKTLYNEREASNIAAVLIEEICNISRTDRILNSTKELTANEYKNIDEYLKRLCHHEPLQYVIKKAWFHRLELFVNEDVLIPRPETEELVEWLIKDITDSGLNMEPKPNQADKTTKLKILDVGSGSGCIALAIKKALPAAEVWGCDISEKALNVARRNGSSLNIRVDFQEIDFLDIKQQIQLPMVDIIISNPPYIPISEKGNMNKNVIDFEPHTALFVHENDPLIFYKALAEFGKHHLHEDGLMYLEIHEDFSERVQKLFSDFGFSNITVRKDMQGKERMIKIHLKT